MLENHYAKRKPKDSRIADVYASQIYSLLPEEKVLTKDYIHAIVQRYAMSHPDENVQTGFKSVSGAVDSLVQCGFVQEVLGVVLDRFLDKERKK